MLIIVLPPQAQEGGEGTTHGCCITMGGVYTQWAHFLLSEGWGWGGWTQAPVNADTAFLTEHSHHSAPAPSVPPARVKQTLLPPTLLVGPKHVGNPGGFSQDKHFILYLCMEHNFVTSLGRLIWLKEGFELTRTAMAVITTFSFLFISVVRTRTRTAEFQKNSADLTER